MAQTHQENLHSLVFIYSTWSDKNIFITLTQMSVDAWIDEHWPSPTPEDHIRKYLFWRGRGKGEG